MSVLSSIDFLILLERNVPLTLNCRSAFFDCLAMCRATTNAQASPREQHVVGPLSCAVYGVHSCPIEHIVPDQERSQSIPIIECEPGKGRERSNVEIGANTYFANVDEAQKIIDSYTFPSSGRHDVFEFVLHVACHGELPEWAQRYLKLRLEQRAVSDPRIELGAKISQGAYGTVYEDSAAPAYVIKQFKNRAHKFHHHNHLKAIENEAALFNAYYGPEAACIISKDSKTYLRMYKVPGESIDLLLPGTLPADALERFVDMLERMQKVGILHADLHCGNFFYDASSEQFHPFDFSNLRQKFFDADTQRKDALNLIHTVLWDKTLDIIRSKKRVV